jgi:hypothetical protein
LKYCQLKNALFALNLLFTDIAALVGGGFRPLAACGTGLEDGEKELVSRGNPVARYLLVSWGNSTCLRGGSR